MPSSSPSSSASPASPAKTVSSSALSPPPTSPVNSLPRALKSTAARSSSTSRSRAWATSPSPSSCIAKSLLTSPCRSSAMPLRKLTSPPPQPQSLADLRLLTTPPPAPNGRRWCIHPPPSPSQSRFKQSCSHCVDRSLIPTPIADPNRLSSRPKPCAQHRAKRRDPQLLFRRAQRLGLLPYRPRSVREVAACPNMWTIRDFRTPLLWSVSKLDVICYENEVSIHPGMESASHRRRSHSRDLLSSSRIECFALNALEYCNCQTAHFPCHQIIEPSFPPEMSAHENRLGTLMWRHSLFAAATGVYLKTVLRKCSRS